MECTLGEKDCSRAKTVNLIIHLIWAQNDNQRSQHTSNASLQYYYS